MVADLRLNDLKILVRDINIVIEDVFSDTTQEEVWAIVQYLVHEGFLKQDGEVNVFIRAKSSRKSKAKRKKEG